MNTRVAPGYPTELGRPVTENNYALAQPDSRMSVVRRNAHKSRDIKFGPGLSDTVEFVLPGKAFILQALQYSYIYGSLTTLFSGCYEIFLDDEDTPIQFDARANYDNAGIPTIFSQPQFVLIGVPFRKWKIMTPNTAVEHLLRVNVWEEPFQPGITIPMQGIGGGVGNMRQGQTYSNAGVSAGPGTPSSQGGTISGGPNPGGGKPPA